jgi:RNA polymerase sigma-70 factor (ECF subfamily)
MIPSPTTRASLLLRLRNSQDHDAWVEFVTLYEPVVYRLLRQTGLQDADSRELLQEFFLAVSRNIDRWNTNRDRGSFRGWLRRVTRNLVINWLKQRSRQSVAAGGSAFHGVFAELPADVGPESAQFDREVRRALFHRAADFVRNECNPKSWEAFWETTVLGNSAEAAGLKLSLSPGAVRVAKCRVLARLREVVTEMGNEE